MRIPGTPCSDGDPCTDDDRCNGSGVCTGTAKSCNSPQNTQCWSAPGRCIDGSCSYVKKAPGTLCNDGNACTNDDRCDGLGNCAGQGTCEICNGLDDDLNDKVDDPGSCWQTVHRFVDPSTGARCWGISSQMPPKPPDTCATYGWEIEAFIVRTNAVPGKTFEARQCSKLTDHIIVPVGSSDYAALVLEGYVCNVTLGHFYELGLAPPSGKTPWNKTCKLWRYKYSAGSTGAHLFTRGPDDVSNMTCEKPPARADVFTNHPCFPDPAPGCSP